MTKPIYIALCGRPTVGKDTVANIIASRTGASIIDDGLPLRQAAPILFGFNPAYPFSQQGKLKEIVMPDGVTKRTVRDCMGTAGALLEAEFGADLMPARAIERAEQVARTEGQSMFLFPSVRRAQGNYYKAAGGVVIEVQREVPASPFEFDNDYDLSCVDYKLSNNGTMEDLEDEVTSFLRWLQQYRANDLVVSRMTERTLPL